MIAFGSMALDNDPISCLFLLQNTNHFISRSSFAQLLITTSSSLSSLLCIFSADEFAVATKRLFILLSASGFFNASIISATHLCEPIFSATLQSSTNFWFVNYRITFISGNCRGHLSTVYSLLWCQDTSLRWFELCDVLVNLWKYHKTTRSLNCWYKTRQIHAFMFFMFFMVWCTLCISSDLLEIFQKYSDQPALHQEPISSHFWCWDLTLAGYFDHL